MKETATPQATPMAMLRGVPGNFFRRANNLVPIFFTDEKEIFFGNTNTPNSLLLTVAAVLNY